MNLLNTPVIPAAEDAWWAPLPTGWGDLQPARVLVVTGGPTDPTTEGRIGKMLSACGLTIAEYRMLSISPETRVPWHQLRDKVSPDLVVLLGVAPQQLGISARLTANQLTGFDARSWILSAAPQTFFADDTLRGHVWNHCLKPFFHL